MTNISMYDVSPVLIECHSGGWLATTPLGWPIGIGVTANSKEEAEIKFRLELKRFEKIPDRFE